MELRAERRQHRPLGHPVTVSRLAWFERSDSPMLLGEGPAFVPSLQGKYPLCSFQTETFEAQTVAPITWPEKAGRLQQGWLGMVGSGAMRGDEIQVQFDDLEVPRIIATL